MKRFLTLVALAALAAGTAVVVVVFFAVSKKVPDYRPEEQ